MEKMMIKSKLPAEKRLELVHVSLMRDDRFKAFVGLFMVGKTEVVDIPLTACTNGRDAKYGREFVDELTDKELAFLVMHENMHKAYRHLTTWRALWAMNRPIANAACDHVINLQLVDMDPSETMIAFPRDKDTNKRIGHYDERFKGMDSKQIFDILVDEEKNKPKRGKGGFGVPSDNGNGGKTDSDVDDSEGGEGENEGGFDEHDWEGAKEMGAEERKQLERDIEQAIRQGGIYAGKTGANMPRELAELLKPRVVWREVLQQFTKMHLRNRESPSWRKAHRNFLWQDVILPSIIGKRLKHLAIGIDASGSVVGPLLDAFLSELNKICRDLLPERIDIMYWDTEVCQHEVFKGSDSTTILHRTSPRGGGGTNPDCIVDFMVKKGINPDALVILSDGYMHSAPAAWARMKAPTLWCIIGNDTYVPPCGQLVNVKEV
jgi:predicted metal-dependent peptidase